MTDADPLPYYLQLADDLLHGRIQEEKLASKMPNLAPLDQALLAAQAESLSTTQPRLGWAIAQVGYNASVAQDADLSIRSLGAWYLARASNHWTQPKRARDAASAAKAGFQIVQENAWLAACDWQFNALAWTQPNFAQAAQALKDALQILEQHKFQEFIPDCRLSLSYAQILIGEHEAAFENIRLSEESYIQNGDVLNQARCWLNQASSYRRQDRFDLAFEKLQVALAVFAEQGSLTDQGKAHYQIAVGYMLQADHLEQAIEHFEKASELFKETDLELWRAMAVNSLGAVFMINGQLTKAATHYQEAREPFVRHEILGLLADNLNDSGKLNVLRGKLAQSVEELKQAVEINQTLGSQLSGAVAMSNLGEAYGQLGRYQDALAHLERAVERLESNKAYFRMATCEKYMAAIWSRLGQPEKAHQYLDRSASHYEIAGQHALLSSVL